MLPFAPPSRNPQTMGSPICDRQPVHNSHQTWTNASSFFVFQQLAHSRTIPFSIDCLPMPLTKPTGRNHPSCAEHSVIR